MSKEFRPCQAMIHPGTVIRDDPQPPEFCEEEAEPGSEFCRWHAEEGP